MRFAAVADSAGWRARTDPADDPEPDVGPAGPTGASMVRAAGASVSLCTMTGRVVHARAGGELGGPGRALLELAFREPIPEAGSGGAPTTFERSARPLSQRAQLVRWAHLHDTLQHVRFGPEVSASVFARIEYVAAAVDLHSCGPAGAALVPLDRVANALTATDVAIAPLATVGGVDQVVDLVGELDVADEVRAGLESVLSQIVRARALTGLVCPGTDLFLNSMIDELEMSFRSAVATDMPDLLVDDLLAGGPLDSGETSRGSRWDSVGAVDTASRAGWVALQQGRAGVASMSTAAGLIFAEAAASWLGAGSAFKAGWSWALADRVEARRVLSGVGQSSVESTLAKIATSPSVPASDDWLAPALWMLVQPVNDLLPDARTPVRD